MASPKLQTTRRGKKKLRRMPGWIAASVAAERLGYSRQYVFDLINDEKIDAFEIAGTGERPACIVVRESTVTRLAAERQERQGCPECRRLREQGIEVPVCEHTHTVGPGRAEDPEVLAALGV